MTTSSSFAEFTLPQRYPNDRRGPVRWIIFHGLRHWQLSLSLLGGAFANAALAAAVPVLIGQAFNAILASPPDRAALIRLAWWIAGTQVLRGVLQSGRIRSRDVFAHHPNGQNNEALRAGLFGKSMTFH